MKELSIEQKAKAYDEVREKIAIRFGSNVAEEIFSEYEESKDERTRKGLLYVIEHHPTLPTEEAEEYIAWLEKQGEKSILFTFDDVLALQCCMETVKKVQEDEELYNELLLLHNKVHDAYTITKR